MFSSLLPSHHYVGRLAPRVAASAAATAAATLTLVAIITASESDGIPVTETTIDQSDVDKSKSLIHHTSTSCHNPSFSAPRRIWSRCSPLLSLSSSTTRCEQKKQPQKLLPDLDAQQVIWIPFIVREEDGQGYPVIYTIQGVPCIAMYTEQSLMEKDLAQYHNLKHYKSTFYQFIAKNQIPKGHGMIVNPRTENRFFNLETIRELQKIAV